MSPDFVKRKAAENIFIYDLKDWNILSQNNKLDPGAHMVNTHDTRLTVFVKISETGTAENVKTWRCQTNAVKSHANSRRWRDLIADWAGSVPDKSVVRVREPVWPN